MNAVEHVYKDEEFDIAPYVIKRLLDGEIRLAVVTESSAIGEDDSTMVWEQQSLLICRSNHGCLDGQ